MHLMRLCWLKYPYSFTAAGLLSVWTSITGLRGTSTVDWGNLRSRETQYRAHLRRITRSVCVQGQYARAFASVMPCVHRDLRILIQGVSHSSRSHQHPSTCTRPLRQPIGGDLRRMPGRNSWGWLCKPGRSFSPPQALALQPSCSVKQNS
jgi:hypothetical protein